MTNEEIKNIKKKIVPDVEVKEGRASEFTDGVADTTVALAKTLTEVARAPLRTAGRIIDGAVQGAKQGAQQSDNPVEGTAKVASGTVIGTAKGMVKGATTAIKKIGEGLQETGEAVKKVGSSLAPKSKEIEEEK
ncbi:MAG: hypothetical protein GPJ54_04965 [Candidatus Heimdallarchaeota archaeon]|nr:hypothetical protein [Candidatus Heimdallarchaeota archaeon]